MEDFVKLKKFIKNNKKKLRPVVKFKIILMKLSIHTLNNLINERYSHRKQKGMKL